MTINVEEKPTARYSVTPTIAGVPTPMIQADGVGTLTSVPILWRVIINPGDDTTAANALLAGYDDVDIVLLDSSLTIGPTDYPITSVHAIAIGTGALPADYTGNAYIISRAETDPADVLAQRAKWVFAAESNVREIELVSSAVYETNYARLICKGWQYA